MRGYGAGGWTIGSVYRLDTRGTSFALVRDAYVGEVPSRANFVRPHTVRTRIVQEPLYTVELELSPRLGRTCVRSTYVRLAKRLSMGAEPVADTPSRTQKCVVVNQDVAWIGYRTQPAGEG
jgi:hypothetical protein